MSTSEVRDDFSMFKDFVSKYLSLIKLEVKKMQQPNSASEAVENETELISMIQFITSRPFGAREVYKLHC